MSKQRIVIEDKEPLRFDQDKYGKHIPVYKRSVRYLTSEQVRIFEKEDTYRKDK